MSRTKAILAGVLMLLLAAPAAATPNPLVDLVSTESVMRWINAYRTKPDPAGVSAAIKALSRFGAFKDPEQGGVFVGFLAGAIATNPDKADQLINKVLPLPPGDQWVLVRGIAYSVSLWRAAAALSVPTGAERFDLGYDEEQGHWQGAAQGPCARAEPGAP
jgi:hypothetical protein